jgi:hypothetical protein
MKMRFAAVHESCSGTNETHDLSRRISAHLGEADVNAAARQCVLVTQS